MLMRMKIVEYLKAWQHKKENNKEVTFEPSLAFQQTPSCSQWQLQHQTQAPPRMFHLSPTTRAFSMKNLRSRMPTSQTCFKPHLTTSLEFVPVADMSWLCQNLYLIYRKMQNQKNILPFLNTQGITNHICHASAATTESNSLYLSPNVFATASCKI